MRRLRVVITSGAVPTLVATLLAPACGAEGSTTGDASVDAQDASLAPDRADAEIVINPDPPDASDAAPPPLCTYYPAQAHFVDLPPPGTPADPNQICAVAVAPVASNTAARVLITNYSSATDTAQGFVSIDPSLAPLLVGKPTVTQLAGSPFAEFKVSGMFQLSAGHYQFALQWPSPLPHPTTGAQMVVKTSFAMTCADGGVQTVEALTKIDFCIDTANNSFDWVSSGDVCTICTVIAEMAPSPIVSDNQGDDLPLGRVVRLRVVEVARAGDQVLLFAENDGGPEVSLEWRVSGGRLEKVADDLMLWTMPEDRSAFGQVAAWSAAGAGVENFQRGYA